MFEILSPLGKYKSKLHTMKYFFTSNRMTVKRHNNKFWWGWREIGALLLLVQNVKWCCCCHNESSNSLARIILWPQQFYSLVSAQVKGEQMPTQNLVPEYSLVALFLQKVETTQCLSPDEWFKQNVVYPYNRYYQYKGIRVRIHATTRMNLEKTLCWWSQDTGLYLNPFISWNVQERQIRKDKVGWWLLGVGA